MIIFKAISQVRHASIGRKADRREPLPSLPDLPSFTLAHSPNGQPIPGYQIGQGPVHILLVAGLHGNEIGTVKLAHYLIQELAETADRYPELRFTVIPCLNQDGYSEAMRHPDYLHGGRRGRFNGHGVDLNRNFKTKSFQTTSAWNHGKNYSERTPVFCGAKGNSEIETSSLTQYIKKEKVHLVMSFHSRGSDVTPSNDPTATRLAKLYAEKSGYSFFSQREWLKLGQTGTFKEWCEENDVLYVEVEASSRWGSDWNRQKPALEALFEKAGKL